MINEDILRDTLLACQLHFKRMMFAHERVTSLIPLDAEKYRSLADEEIGFFDQLIYRFSKLQDTMGTKLFKVILNRLEEETDDLAFIDILNKLEKLNILEDKDQWLALRELRNEVTHEYPFNTKEITEGLNELYKQCFTLSDIWQKVKDYSLQKFNITLLK